MKVLIHSSVLVILLLITSCQKVAKEELKGEYLGQKLLSDSAEVFARGIVSTGMYDRDITISPDGKEIYFGVALRSLVTILYCKEINGVWSKPEVASFATNPDYFFFEPHYTPDGKHLMFLSTTPPPGEEAKPGWFHQHIWIVDKQSDGSWSEPHLAGSPITTGDNDYFPSTTKSGTIYFTRSFKSNPRESFIYRSRKEGDKYLESEKLPDIINKDGGVYNAFISPDESYLITCTTKRSDLTTEGFADYYIFFRNDKDEWSEGINMGSKVNFENDNALSPYVSPDGRYFFFSSAKLSPEIKKVEGGLTARQLEEFYQSPGNGNSDTYWIKAEFINKLKPAGF